MKKSSTRTLSEAGDRQYRNIFEAANDGLIVSDLETGLVVEANPAAGLGLDIEKNGTTGEAVFPTPNAGRRAEAIPA